MLTTLNLKVGSILHDMEQNIDHRVIYMNKDYFVTILINGIKEKTEINEWHIQTLQHFVNKKQIAVREPKFDKVFDFDSLPEKTKEIYLRNKDIVETFGDIYGPCYFCLGTRKPKPCFQELADKYNISKKTVFYVIKQYLTNGLDPFALLPQIGKKSKANMHYSTKTGRPPMFEQGIPLTDELREIFDDCCKHYLSGREKSYATTYDWMLTKYFTARVETQTSKGVVVQNKLLPIDQRPTKSQMENYIVTHTSAKARRVCKISKREYRNNERMLVSDNLLNVHGPGDLFEMDEVEMDVSIDNALGNPEPIYEVMINKKCKSLADKQLKVCQLIEMFSIGTIVMDEIQLIDFNTNRENSYEGLLGIVNKTKVALSVVGTDEAYKKLFTMLRNARRAGDFIDASAYTTDKDYFNMLVNMLLTWQWLDTPIQWSKELSDTLYECLGGIINMLIWLYKWIMLEYIDSKSKGKIETIDKKFIVRVNNKHFKQLKGAIDIVNQARTEELEDERILTIAEEEKNKYQMPESNISNMVYESKMMTKVIDLVREIYVEFDSDSIGKATRMVLEEDVNHRLKPHEVAKQVIAILNEEPVKPKRKATRRTPASKNICDYITDDN